jgi:hypothetical protein
LARWINAQDDEICQVSELMAKNLVSLCKITKEKENEKA